MNWEAGSLMADVATQRAHMVEQQIEARGVRDPRVLEALRQVPREIFVAPSMAEFVYADSPLEIEEGQTISQPFIVAIMTELLDPTPSDAVLEIGTGCGYETAVLAEIVSFVYSVDVVGGLAEAARERLATHDRPMQYARPDH